MNDNSDTEDSTSAQPPKVSIGLPVHNGERYVAEAIASILVQTFRDFELIICDNASTDRTQAICLEFAARDERIRYHRQPRNLGATANFNHCVALARGKYFRWAAADDLVEPRFLEACVGALEDDPGAILAQSLIRVVGDGGDSSEIRDGEIYDHSTFDTLSPRPSERLAGRLRGTCMEVFGVMSTAVLRDTVMIGDYIGSDRALLIELAVRGRFALVPEVLFINRDHPERCTRIARTRGGRKALIAWYNTQANPRWVLSTWSFYVTSFRVVRRHVRHRRERTRCYRHLVGSASQPCRAVFLLLEPLQVIDPRIFTLARRIKQAYKRVRRQPPLLPRSPDPA